VALVARGRLPEQLDRIDGELVPPRDVLVGAPLCDPSTGEALQPRRATAPGDVERAIATSHRVHRSGEWADLGVDERAAWLERIAVELDAATGGDRDRDGDSDGCVDSRDAVAIAESTGSGVPISVTRLFAGSLAGAFRGAIAQLRAAGVRTELPGPVRPVELLRLPWGPAAVLVPWNAPAAMAAGKVATALAAGCPVLLKPPEWSPLGCNLLADALHRAGLPPGVFQMVHGGPATGAALTSDPRVRVVSFTGGLAAGRAIARAAAEHFPALQLELGGNNPAIVRPDAPLEATAAALAAGIAKLNGQWCEAPGKVLVARELHDDLVDAVREHLARRTIGHHLDPDTAIGPLSHESHRARLDHQVAELVADGAEVLVAGEAPDLPGWFWPPRLVVGVAAERCVDELFGPVVTVHPVDGDSDAVALANDTPYGLAGYVFSADLDAAQAIGRRIRFGEVKVNGTSVIDLTPASSQSFWGLSGIGGHGAAEVFRSFTGTQIVGVDHPEAPI
jgi:phenylacetaldehyde dehydrogenase